MNECDLNHRHETSISSSRDMFKNGQSRLINSYFILSLQIVTIVRVKQCKGLFDILITNLLNFFLMY